VFRKIHLELQPVEDGLLEHSDGYLVYSALLNELQKEDEQASEQLHDEPDVIFNVSTLDGPFGTVDIDGSKMVFSDGLYDVNVGLVGEEVPYEPFLEMLLNPDTTLQISGVDFTIQSVSTEETTPAELIEDPENCAAVQFRFEDPTRIISDNGTSEPYPHRRYVFDSILGKWNYAVPEPFKFDLDRDDIEKCSRQPIDGSIDLEYHSIVVARDGDEKKERPAFTADVTYCPSEDSDDWLKLVVLARAAEYLGVGADTARGLGTVSIEALDKW
jgi:hypothetical protein